MTCEKRGFGKGIVPEGIDDEEAPSLSFFLMLVRRFVTAAAAAARIDRRAGAAVQVSDRSNVREREGDDLGNLGWCVCEHVKSGARDHRYRD